MTVKSTSISAVTLARSGAQQYQVSYWSDGVARFDGQRGQRQGAWEAQFEPERFKPLRKLARSLDSRETADPVVTVIVDAGDDRLTYEAGNNEPPGLWTVGTLIDGMIQRTRWSPLDVAEESDFRQFSRGIPLWMSAGEVVASGYGLPGAILVLAGARVSTTTSPSLESTYQDRRTQLVEEGALVLEDDSFRLTRHLMFASPSAASSVLVGSNASGRRAWRDGRGVAWSELGLDG